MINRRNWLRLGAMLFSLSCLSLTGIASENRSSHSDTRCVSITIDNTTQASIVMDGQICPAELYFGGFEHVISRFFVAPKVDGKPHFHLLDAGSQLTLRDMFGNIIMTTPPLQTATAIKCEHEQNGINCTAEPL